MTDTGSTGDPRPLRSVTNGRLSLIFVQHHPFETAATWQDACRWTVDCSTCGRLGVPLDRLSDATKVARRHVKVRHFGPAR